MRKLESTWYAKAGWNIGTCGSGALSPVLRQHMGCSEKRKKGNYLMSGALDGDEGVLVEHLRVTRHRLHARYVPRPSHPRHDEGEREREQSVSEPPRNGVYA